MVERLLWGLRYEDAAELIQRGLALLGKRESVDRCRLLAWTGLTLSVAGYYSAGDTVLRRALAMAERIGDANVLGSAQLGTAVHHFCYAQMREAAECGVKGTDLLRRAGNLWDLTQGSIFVGYALLDVGRLDESLNLLREGGLLAKRLGSSASSYEFYLALLREGDIDACESHGRAGLERAQAGEDHASTWTDVAVLGTAQFWRGRWREALDTFAQAAKLAPSGALAGIAEASILLASAYAGDRETALAILQREGLGAPRERAGRPASSPLLMVRAARASGLGVSGLLGVIRESRAMKRRSSMPRRGRPNTLGSWTMLFAAAEALTVVDERAEAAKLYPLVLEGVQLGNLFRGIDFRLVDTVAGIAAGAGQQWDKAEEHFRKAIRRTEELPHIIEQPEARRCSRRSRDSPPPVERGNRDVPSHRHAEARRDGGESLARCPELLVASNLTRLVQMIVLACLRAITSSGRATEAQCPCSLQDDCSPTGGSSRRRGLRSRCGCMR